MQMLLFKHLLQNYPLVDSLTLFWMPLHQKSMCITQDTYAAAPFCHAREREIL